MAYGVAAGSGEYDALWGYISWLNGGNVFLNRQGEGFDIECPDLAAVAGYCARGGVYVDYCGWPMLYDHRGGNANADRFRQFLAYAGADPNYCVGFTREAAQQLPCDPGLGYAFRYGWLSTVHIPPVAGGGRIAASYEAPSNVCPSLASPQAYIYSAAGVKVYSDGAFKGWYFYGVGDAARGSVGPQVYARFIKECVRLYPPPGGDGSDEPGPGCEPSACTSEPVLRRGSTGPCVGWIQQRLKQLGYAPGPTDCVFGLRTEAAVKQFQEDKGLIMDGIVGPQTWAALKSAADGAGLTDEERCLRAGGTWDPVSQMCVVRKPGTDYLLYVLIGGAIALAGAGIYLAIRR